MIDMSQLAEPGSAEERLLRQIDLERIPRHVAVIMDGNGRWARERRLPRVAGHRAGIDGVRETVETSARLGVQVLTLYAFSKENWKRPLRPSPPESVLLQGREGEQSHPDPGRLQDHQGALFERLLELLQVEIGNARAARCAP